jgi:general secretion pathway protein M
MKPGGQLAARWQALGARERRLLLLAAAVVGAALLWWLALAPALSVLRAAPARHAALDAQLSQMRSLQVEAKALRDQPKMGGNEALRALDASVKERLGGAGQLTVVGERATVTLRGVPADTLAVWLSQARVNARAVPTEARLIQSPSAAGKPGVAWDGSVVLTLPAR